MYDKKVSVVIPTYNNSVTLHRAIKSVISQTFQDFEILVVDDGSENDVEKITKSFSDSRIKFFKHLNNKGVSAARNTGIKQASFPLIAFLDADDEWMLNKLEDQIDVLKSSIDKSLGLIYGGGIFEYKDGTSFIMLPSKKGDILFNLLVNNYILGGGSTCLVKKEVFELSGYFDENLKIGEDWEMWIRIAEKYKVDYVNKPLFKYCISESSATNIQDLLRKKKDFNYIYNKHKVLFDSYPKAHSSILRNLGTFCIKKGNPYDARQYFLKAMIINPFDYKSMISFIISFFGLKIYQLIFDLKNKLRKIGFLKKQ